MKFFKIIGFVVAGMISTVAFGQEYSEMPVPVQQKMNENKAQGLDIYQGIDAHFEVKLINLESAQAPMLTQQLNADQHVNSASLSPDMKTLTLVTEAPFTIEQVKEYVKMTQAEIADFTITYEVSE